jgi:hypothetical protein
MNTLLILTLATTPLLGACSAEGLRAPAEPALDKRQPQVAEAAQPAQHATWALAVASAKVAGSLYRAGAFFPDVTAAADAAAAMP